MSNPQKKGMKDRTSIEKALRESEKKFEKIFHNSSTLIAISTIAEGLFIDVNESFLKRLGFQKDEVLGKTSSDLNIWVNPDERDKIIQEFSEKKNIENIEVKIRTKSGEIIDGLFSADIVDIKNRPLLLTMMQDITERKNIEETLYHEQDLIQTLLDNHPDFIYFKDINTRFQHISKRFCDYLKLTEEEIIGKTDLDLFPEEVAIQSHNEELNIIKTGIPLINKEQTDGKTWVLSTKMPWLDKKGSLKGLFGISRDITDLKNAEQNIKESEEKFRTIAEQLLMGIVIIQDDVVKYANQRMIDLFGYSIEEIINWESGEFTKLFAPDSVEFVLDQAKKKQSGLPDQIKQYQIHCVKKSGELFWVENFSKTILYDGNSADLITVIDITERKKAEERLKESEQKYRKAYEQANLYKDLISHDMNNIVGAIQGSIELFSLLQDSPEHVKKEAELMEVISMSTKKAKKLISNVNILSKIEEGIDTSLVSVDILNLVSEAIKFTQVSFQDREIKIRIEAPTNMIYDQANNLLLDVFENLLNNAVKYNDNPIVEISIKISKEHLGNRKNIKLEFMDNGFGITDKQKKHIFQRSRDNLKGGKGLGFGLSVVKKVIEGFNGKLLVEDRIKDDYSRGSNFIIILPLDV